MANKLGEFFTNMAASLGLVKKDLDQTNEKKPLMQINTGGTLFGSDINAGMFSKNAYEVFYQVYNNTPELYGLFTRIRSDILADGYTINAEDEEEASEIAAYLQDIDFDEKIEATINDLLITGDGFDLVSTLSDEQLKEVATRLIKEAGLMNKKLNTSRIVEQVNTPYKYNIFPIKASTITGQFDESGYPIKWVQTVDGKTRVYDAKNVIHIKLNPVANDPFGNTALYSLRNVVIAALIYLRDRNMKYFQQGGTPNNVFMTKAKYGSDSYNRIANILKEFNKPQNSHKNILLSSEDEMVVQKLKEAQDMDFATYWDKLVETIFVAWGMPPTVAGLLGNSKVGESSFAHDAYYKNIDILQRKLEQKLNKQFFSYFGKDITIEFNRAYKQDEVREVDIELKRLMIVQTKMQMGLMSKEAAARELEIPEEDMPEDNGDDEDDLASKLIKKGEQDAAMNPETGKNHLTPQQAAMLMKGQKEPVNKVESHSQAHSHAFLNSPPKSIQETKGQVGGVLLPTIEDSDWGSGKFLKLEEKYARDLTNRYETIGKAIQRIVEANNRESSTGKIAEKLDNKMDKVGKDVEAMFALQKKGLQKIVKENLALSYDAGRQHVTEELKKVTGKDKIGLSEVSRNRFDVLKVSSFDLVDGLDKETKKKLVFNMNEAILNREGIPDIKKRIAEVMDTTMSRAELIARTETIRTLNESAMATYQDSGVVNKVQWIAKLDERTAEADGNAHGSVVNFGEAFPYVDVAQPPAHPNCRCRVVAYFDDPSVLKF